MAAVFLDIDGTLLKGTSCEVELFAALFNQGRIGPRQVLSYLLFAARYWFRFGENVLKKDKAYLKGLNAAEVEAAGARLAKERLPGHFNPRMMERLEAHKQAGDRVVLLSGSPDFIVKHIASELGVGDFIAARLAARKGRFISALPELHPFGPEKVRLAEDFCRTHDQRLAQAVAYADSISDLPLLERVGKAVAVTPDGGLEKIARGRNWEIMR